MFRAPGDWIRTFLDAAPTYQVKRKFVNERERGANGEARIFQSEGGGGGGGHTVSKRGYSPDCHVATCCRLFALKKAYKVRATPGPTPLAMPLGVGGLRKSFI